MSAAPFLPVNEGGQTFCLELQLLQLEQATVMMHTPGIPFECRKLQLSSTWWFPGLREPQGSLCRKQSAPPLGGFWSSPVERRSSLPTFTQIPVDGLTWQELLHSLYPMVRNNHWQCMGRACGVWVASPASVARTKHGGFADALAGGLGWSRLKWFGSGLIPLFRLQGNRVKPTKCWPFMLCCGFLRLFGGSV